MINEEIVEETEHAHCNEHSCKKSKQNVNITGKQKAKNNATFNFMVIHVD